MLKHDAACPVIPRRVVVMGAGGFIGASLIKRLSRKNVSHVALTSSNLDLLRPGASDKLADIVKPEDALVVISAIPPVKTIKCCLKTLA